MSTRQSTQTSVPQGCIDLGIGHPSPSLLPLALLRAAAARRLGGEDRSFLQYGYEQGDLAFRAALAQYLEEASRVAVSPEHLFVSNGVSQALDLLCSLYARPGDTVLVEEPAYFLALRIFADHGLRTVGVPTDRSGLIPEALEEAARRHHPLFLYTVPSHQNPTGATLPADRRRRLAVLSEELGFLIVADEVYHLLSYGGQPPAPFSAFVPEAKVLSLGSFSKILAPGLRLGWIHAGPALLRPLVRCGVLDSGGGLNPFTAAVVGSLLERGELAPHVETLKAVYGERARLMAELLERELPAGVRFGRARGGFFLWLTLPEGAEASALLPAARAAGVAFLPGARFSATGGMRSCLRLSFSYYDTQQLAAGARRLARVLRAAPAG